MQRITKALAAIMLMTATMFVAGCTEKLEQPAAEDIHLTEGEWIDLGLPSGLLWASCNVGATAPEEFGDYFAWGETQPKSVYADSNYAYYFLDCYQIVKYCFDSTCGYNGYTDTLTILEPCDDAATANLGDGARTPTKENYQELIDNTISKWTTYNGVEGRIFTGLNGNNIFIPAAGMRIPNPEEIPQGMIFGNYWTSSLRAELDIPGDWFYPWLAVHLTFSSDVQRIGMSSRAAGFPVRAVCSASKE